MDPDILLKRAEQNVVAAEQIVTKQRMLIHGLMVLGSDTASAERLLQTFTGSLEIFRRHHATIVRRNAPPVSSI